jgi:hypothetical protein
MGVVLDTAEVINQHGLDIGAAALDHGAQDQSADAAEPINRNFNRHV